MPKTGAVLIIDDEELIREAVIDILELVNIETYAAASGEEGCNLFQSHAEEISVVILDMHMPHMSGEETYIRLCTLDPDIKVIFSSGYSEDSSSGLFQELQNTKPVYFLQKPYPIDALIDLVQKVQAS